MSIVSGVATAPGIAPLLNAPRETHQGLRVDPSTAPTRSEALQSTGRLTARPVVGVADGQGKDRPPEFRHSTDSRYERFVQAVQVLRMDFTEDVLDEDRVRRLLDSAEDFFLVDDGIPREVQPLPPDPESRVEPMVTLDYDPILSPDEQVTDTVKTDDDPAAETTESATESAIESTAENEKGYSARDDDAESRDTREPEVPTSQTRDENTTPDDAGNGRSDAQAAQASGTETPAEPELA